MNFKITTPANDDGCSTLPVSTESPRMFWPQLDGLRFMAAMLVYIAHAPELPGVLLQGLKKFGWCGVDLFLVLSAFLLTRLLRAEFRSSGAIDLRKFYVRRMLRIWPLYWGFVSVMLIISLVMKMGAVGELFGFWLSHLCFINNAVVSSVGFERRLPFTSHLWTISLEEQFYFIIPLVLSFLLKRQVKVSIIWIGVAGALAVMIGGRGACTLLNVPHPLVWVLPIRGDSIIFGVALGIGLLGDRVSVGRAIGCGLLGCSILTLGALMPSMEEPGWSQIFGYTVVDSGCALLVMGALSSGFATKFLGNPVLRYLGKISFGIYVFHTLALALANKVGALCFQGEKIGVFVLGLAITIGFAAGSYHFFERYFLLLKQRFSNVASRPV